MSMPALSSDRNNEPHMVDYLRFFGIHTIILALSHTYMDRKSARLLSHAFGVIRKKCTPATAISAVQ